VSHVPNLPDLPPPPLVVAQALAKFPLNFNIIQIQVLRWQALRSRKPQDALALKSQESEISDSLLLMMQPFAAISRQNRTDITTLCQAWTELNLEWRTAAKDNFEKKLTAITKKALDVANDYRDWLTGLWPTLVMQLESSLSSLEEHLKRLLSGKDPTGEALSEEALQRHRIGIIKYMNDLKWIIEYSKCFNEITANWITDIKYPELVKAIADPKLVKAIGVGGATNGQNGLDCIVTVMPAVRNKLRNANPKLKGF